MAGRSHPGAGEAGRRDQRLHPQRVLPAELNTLEASIVIPTMNAGPIFDEVLGRLFSQETDFDYEVVVLDSGSTDGTVETARKHGAIVHAINPVEFDHGATRDLGASLSRGEYVAFTVQDALPLDGRWLAAMVEDLRGAERVAGGLRTPTPSSTKQPPDPRSGEQPGHREPGAPGAVRRAPG